MKQEKINKFVRAFKNDMRAFTHEEELINGETCVRFKIGSFKLERKIRDKDNYDYEVKKLFEDFITISTGYYRDRFWDL